jgi:ABC-type multidrug transport system fused ATPase/permease subunit
VASALISFYSLIIYIVYSIANPESKYSLTQSKVYELITYTQETQLFNSVLTNASNLIDSFIPVSEIKSAYDLLIEFVRPEILNKKIQYLLFITFHIQTAMGFLGIEFLRNEQSRKNALIKIEDELKKHKEETTKEKTGPKMQNGKSKSTPVPNNSTEQEIDLSKKFRSSAAPFIIFIALPYMAQIVFYGAVNMFALHCFRDDIHRTIRLNDLFDNGGHRFVATSNASTLSPGAYATNSETVVSNVYDLFNKNLFSLPKLMLLPQIIAKQPMLLIKITPLILLSDYVKSVIVATITTETERISKQMKEMEAARNKIEEYDLKNSELIQRSGYDSIAFTEGRWVDLTESIQELKATSSLMTRSKMYFQWLQRHFVMMALVDCALARLIAVGKIVSADIFVYARAIEDFIGFIFMRSRAESELASMVTSIKVLKELKQIWNESADRNLLNCNVDEDGGFEMQDLAYSRGSAFVNITDISLPNGIYALTGANGSGKSTLFRLIMACDSNRKSIDMDSSIIIKTPGFVNMPSNNVVEISQNFYWPLNTAPIEWIYHKKLSNFNTDDKEEMINNLVKELQSLKLYPDTQPGSDLRNDLISTKDDWFSDLSGGQKSKVELVRKVSESRENHT